ncbi:hypothetical protein EDM54_23815 [Brevibacillus borstelensis]|uniref:hypothetical protein n=1 Tax=Brevibacillus borstelensis TaxID=45462 RepID=UPI000F07EDBC|nr:hypothetical protein [Brevibacillus borstelensis]MED1882367.1 hypothetical protein [Brevibacillus borstelensis]RNB56648.1 hypothetical protein EDM54_23815 [Brevibacillus borstelensis]GED55849.1 hypothetical protein BBO01nite_50900 [Brevibacillus borstelensis]
MSGRGGKREGAGRKKVGIMRKVSVNMPQEFWNYADAFGSFTECISHLWEKVNGNQNQNVDSSNQNRLDEIRNQIHTESFGDQNQTLETSNQNQQEEIGNQYLPTDSEKKKITKESKYIFDVIGIYSDPTLVIVRKFESIGPKLAPLLFEKLLTRKFDDNHLAAIHEAWTQYKVSQYKLEELRRQQDQERQFNKGRREERE